MTEERMEQQTEQQAERQPETQIEQQSEQQIEQVGQQGQQQDKPANQPGKRKALSTDRLGTKSILKLLFEFSIPAIIMMTFNALYNIVDSIFLGQAVGEAGIAVTTLAFPIMVLLMGLSALAGQLRASSRLRASCSSTRFLRSWALLPSCMT